MERTPRTEPVHRRTILIEPGGPGSKATPNHHPWARSVASGGRPLHRDEYRGFERFLRGAPVTEMAAIRPAFCGICPGGATFSLQRKR